MISKLNHIKLDISLVNGEPRPVIKNTMTDRSVECSYTLRHFVAVIEVNFKIAKESDRNKLDL